MARNFKEWLSTFRPCISDYCYYVDFNKVHRNIDNIKVELNILNTLVGSKILNGILKTSSLNILKL